MPKKEDIHRLWVGIANPFLQDRVDSPWQEAFQDVPEINQKAFQSCLNSVEAVYRGNQSRGLILHGEPGSGKTHLLQRLRFFTQKDPRTWFIYIPPFTGPGRFWRHLLERFFYDICQRSKESERSREGAAEEGLKEEGPGQGPLTQIEEALTRHLMAKPLDSTQELSRWWQRICQQDAPGEALFKRLGSTFDHLTVRYRLDPEVMKVLRQYVTWNHRSIAYAYLLGRDLPEEELALLKVKNSLEDEERAKQAVLTFCHLAGRNFTIILAFDQIEGLQLTIEDLDGLRTFGNNAVDLMGQCENLLVLSAVQTYFLKSLNRAIHTAYYDRIAQDESVLGLLTRDSAKRLIEYRLRHLPELVDLKKQDRTLDPLWPFTQRQIEQLIPAGGLSARELIRKARHLLEGMVSLPSRPQPPPQPVEEMITRFWRESFERELEKPVSRLDEGVFEDGILRLLQIKPPKGWKIHRAAQEGLDIVFEGKEEKVGVSISNSENMNSLARRLKRLQDIAAQGQVSKIVFLRDARLPISPRAVKAQERLKDLVQKGTRVVRPPAEAYAALSVLRQLWAKAAENDLTMGDTSVSMGQLQRWLAENTPRPLQELMDAVQEIPFSVPEALADRFLEFLDGRWIMPIKDAAQELGMSEAEISRFVIEKPELTGLLAGPPAVLFLNPEAVGRYG
jgi:hypothetical protein